MLMPELDAGVSVENDYDVNSLAVPRRAKEAIGAIALLHNEVRALPSARSLSPASQPAV